MKKELQGLWGIIRHALLFKGRTASSNMPQTPVDDESDIYLDTVKACWNFATEFALVELIEYEGEEEPVISPARNYSEQVATLMREYVEARGYKIKRRGHPKDGKEG